MLRRKAAQRQQSTNRLIPEELAGAAGARTRKADFPDLVGRWIADPAFDETSASQRQIDWDKWK